MTLRGSALAVVLLLMVVPVGAQQTVQRLVTGYPPFTLGMTQDQALVAAGVQLTAQRPVPGVPTEAHTGRIDSQIRNNRYPANLRLEFLTSDASDLRGRLVVIAITWFAGNLAGDPRTRLKQHAHYLREDLLAHYDRQLLRQDNLPSANPGDLSDRPGEVELRDESGNSALLSYRPPFEVSLIITHGGYARLRGVEASPAPRASPTSQPAVQPTPSAPPQPSVTPQPAPSPAVQPPPSGQPQFFSIPQDPIVAYFRTIVVPLLSGSLPPEKDLVAYYRTYVSLYSQSQVAEDQFSAYWRGEGAKVIGASFLVGVLTGGSPNMTYDIGDPVYNETRDQARFKVSVTMTYGSVLRPQKTNTVVFAHVIREGSFWKWVISPETVAGMRKYPTRITTRRIHVMRTVSVAGVTLTVAAVSMEREITLLEVIVENGQDQTADLLEAISGATLVDQLGTVYSSRILRTSLTNSVPPRQTVQGSIGFAAVPLSSRAIRLSLPNVRVGESTFTLSLEIALGP